MKCGLFVTFAMVMSALNALQKVLMRTMIFIVLLVQLRTFETTGGDVCW